MPLQINKVEILYSLVNLLVCSSPKHKAKPKIQTFCILFIYASPFSLSVNYLTFYFRENRSYQGKQNIPEFLTTKPAILSALSLVFVLLAATADDVPPPPMWPATCLLGGCLVTEQETSVHISPQTIF